MATDPYAALARLPAGTFQNQVIPAYTSGDVYTPEMSSLGINAGIFSGALAPFQSKYNWPEDLGDGRYALTFQNPGMHKYDTLRAVYRLDPATGEYVMEGGPAQTRQISSGENFRDAAEAGIPFVGAVLGGAYGLSQLAGAGAAAGGTAAPAAGGAFIPAGSTGLTAPAATASSGFTGGGLLTGGAVPASAPLTIAGSGGGAAAAGAGTGALTIAGASAPAGASFVTPGLGSSIGAAPAAAGGGMTMGNYLTAAQLASGLYGSYQQGQAAEAAAAAQQAAAQQGITAQQQALQQVRADLSPYTQAGPGALKAQQDLAGLNGPQAQQAAIAALQASPQFTAQQQLGEERILANASATGGLRGGNVQAALAQFSPALLADTINQQYSRLGGLVQVGQNSAAGVGTATLGTANNTSNLLQQQGAAAAGGALAQGRTQLGYLGALTNALGLYAGLNGGF